MRRQGVEDIKGKTPLVPDQPPKQHRRRLSKAELREQAEAAFLAWREGQKVIITTPGTKNPRYVSEQTARYHRSRNGGGTVK